MLPTPSTEPTPPCAACVEQVELDRLARPHRGLDLVASQSFLGFEERVFRCDNCGSMIEHTSDDAEPAPFWWFAR